jgi:D-3-phosphoglycerate dehydrogenase
MSEKKKVIFGGVPGMDKKYRDRMKKGIIKEYENVDFIFFGENTITDEELIEKYSDAHILVSWDQEMNENTYKSMPNLKAYCQASVGFNAANIPIATKYGVIVTNVSDYCIDEVSNHTIALILACARKLYIMGPKVKMGIWDCAIAGDIKRFTDSTIGLYGFGKIAKEVSKKLKGFNVNIIANDPYVSKEEGEKYGVTMVDFNTLVKTSDYISLHTPLLPSTEDIFNKTIFKKMKPTAFIINTSRGKLINQQDLYEALTNNIIAGAALDVLKNEPPEDEDKKIIQLPNTIVTAHSAFVSIESAEQQIDLTCKNVGRILRGEKPNYICNPQVLDKIHIT